MKKKLDPNSKVMHLTSNLPHLQESDYAKHLSKDSKYLHLEPQRKRRSRSKSFGERSGARELASAEQKRDGSTDDDMPQEDEDSPQVNRVDDYNHLEIAKPLDSKQTLQSGADATAEKEKEKERYKAEFQKQIPMSLQEVKDLSVKKLKDKVAVSLAGKFNHRT